MFCKSFAESTRRCLSLAPSRVHLESVRRGIMSTPCKMAKNTQYIGTHDGTFHCDDVTACFMLKQLDRFKNHEIVRTRDPQLLADAEIIVDVGSELDVDRLRLDHHQRSFNQNIHHYHPNLKVTNPKKPPRLSSSGLVFAVFGKEVIIKLLSMTGPYEKLSDDEKKMIDAIYDKSYIEFFEEIDAIDNGVEVAEGSDLVYNYHISSGISSRVGRLNPYGDDVKAADRLDKFHEAMKVVGAEISEGIRFLGQKWWPARQRFREFVTKRHEIDPSGQIVRLEGDMTGYKSAIMELEEELGCVGEIKFVVYQDAGDKPKWRATTLPVSLKSFASRVPLLEAWRGKRDEELASVSGIADAMFVHMSGFTGGAVSYESVIKMVRISLGLEK